jgi:hypothetical protein
MQAENTVQRGFSRRMLANMRGEVVGIARLENDQALVDLINQVRVFPVQRD